MLSALQKIASLLRPALPLTVALGLGGLALFVWATSRDVPAEQDAFLTGGLLAMLWGALLFTLVTGFHGPPAPPDPTASRWRGLRARLARRARALLAWLWLAAGAAAAFATVRLIGFWR